MRWRRKSLKSRPDCHHTDDAGIEPDADHTDFADSSDVDATRHSAANDDAKPSGGTGSSFDVAEERRDLRVAEP